MRYALLLAAILATGCGRLGFGELHTDAAPDDAALDDAPVDMQLPIDGMPSLCGQVERNLCDGFEGATFDPRWELDIANGAIAIDSTRVYRGSSALHSRVMAVGATPVASPRGSLRTYGGLPIAGTTYLRVFAYIPATTPQRFVQWLNTSNNAGLGASTGMQNTDVVNNDYAVDPSEFVPSPTTQVPLDRWFCLQYEVPTNGPIRVRIDGAEITDVRITPAQPHPAPSHIYLGLDFPDTFSNQPAAEAWFDELALDDAPIACTD